MRAVREHMVCAFNIASPVLLTLQSYCNSILQCLYYSVPFRENVLNYPTRSQTESVQAAAAKAIPRPPMPLQQPNGQPPKKSPNPSSRNPGQPPTGQNQKPEDKDSPEYKKKQALLAGPILNMSYENAKGYGMSESLFASLKDIFEAVVVSQSRIGIISPSKFLETLRKENEMFRTSMHQDAHEFLNLLLNEVVENVEANAKTIEAKKRADMNGHAPEQAPSSVSFPSTLPLQTTTSLNTTRWVHDLFEGTLTSETRCLTCENVSQRDEAFLDLSVDLDQHSSVTSCLRSFSEEEMLCERNKFHCDNCGGLQEAEKRMKIKRLPKILAIHLKRFKYTEDLQRLQKLFHKVVYPYHLRLFNTTDDAEDPDRLYELYAVVVHIGGGPYHGHYVAIIKTEDRGWLLFDDEMVEPVDKSFVRNFFGDRPGLACAYVLFYQETTLEAVQREQEQEESWHGSDDPVFSGATVNGDAGVYRVRSSPPLQSTEFDPMEATMGNLDHAMTSPDTYGPEKPLETIPKVTPAVTTIALAPKSSDVQSKKEKAKEEKERKAAEKAAEKEKKEGEKQRRKDQEKRLRDGILKQQEDFKAAMEASKQTKAEEDRKAGVAAEPPKTDASTKAEAGGLSRFKRGSKSISTKFGSVGRNDRPPSMTDPDTVPASGSDGGKGVLDQKRSRFSIRKKSFSNMLSS